MYYNIFLYSLNANLNYRLQLFIDTAIGFIPSLGVIFVWLYISNTTLIPGYTREEIITYILLAKLLQQALIPSFHWTMIEEIQNGDMARYIVRPLSHLHYCFSKELATILVKFWIVFFSLIPIYIIFFDHLIVPTPSSSLMFLISSIFALILYFLIYYLISLLSFWVIEVYAFVFTADILIEFLSGVLIPLNLFPGFVKSILEWLPFHYMIYLPINTFIGKVNVFEFTQGISIQIIWCISIYIAIRFIWNKAIVKYDGAGL
jgi:ABC-2 type transport system permease protein